MLVKSNLYAARNTLGVMTPLARERTPFKKHGRTYPVAVVYGKPFYAYDIRFHSVLR